MFDKAALLTRLKELPLPPTEYWVVAGGAMVLHGFRAHTRDIDLGCTTRLADQLQRQGYAVTLCGDGTRKIRYAEDIELFENWGQNTVENISDILAVSVAGLLQMKKDLGREKDLADVALIEKAIKSGGGGCMRLRPYIKSKDFHRLAKWIGNEREHALWCGGLYPYPLEAETFHAFLQKMADEWAASAFVVTEENGDAVGFFRYSINPQNDEGFLASIIVDSTLRGKGYGKQMLQLALRYAFELTGAQAVQLNVFAQNAAAKHCYESLGFVERTAEEALVYPNETWTRCNMAITRPQWRQTVKGD